MQPDITFFGEDLPHEFGQRLIYYDRELADLVIVIGTSLKVAPVAEVPGILPRNVPQIYISRTVRPLPFESSKEDLSKLTYLCSLCHILNLILICWVIAM